MAIICFLKIDKIEGLSKDKVHAGWIELVSFNASNSAYDSEVSGSLCLTRNCDSLSAQFYDLLKEQKTLPTVVIDAVNRSGNNSSMMRYTLHDATMTSLNASIYTSTDQVEDTIQNQTYMNNMLEDICFTYKSLGIEHFIVETAAVTNDKPNVDTQAIDESRTPRRYQRES
jgi:type VI secretion system Hcp family effector